MDHAEFDQFADEYDRQHRANIAVTGENPDYFAQYKVRVFRELIAGRVDNLLDFGSGTGNSIPHFQTYFGASQLTCLDVSQRSLDIAQARFANAATGIKISGDNIPLDDASFDAAFSACVFHHIDQNEHLKWLRELRRVVRPGGTLAIFEHNPLNLLTVRAVNTCPFDINAKLIRAGKFAALFRAAGWLDVQISYHVFFPRALALLRPFEKRLTHVPLGAQYSVSALK